MRTTLILEDSVFHKAKKRAMETGTTLSDLTNSALRRFLAARSSSEQPPFVMPVYGRGKRLHQTSEDLAKFRDAGR